MLGLDRRRQVDWCLGKAQVATALAIVFFGAALKADPANFGPFEPFLKWMQVWAWVVVSFGPIVVGAVQWVRRKFGSPWAWEAIQNLIDEFRNDVFKELPEEDPLDHHRVTLFKYHQFAVGWEWPTRWKNWLVAVARSDHLTKDKIRRFRAPDDGEACEGVAGRAWRSKPWILVPSTGTALPQLAKTSTEEEIRKYAEATGVTLEWVRRQLDRGRPLAQSYAAVVVRLKGKPWGVLVLDSRRSGAINPDKVQRFNAYAKLLTPLLERV